MLWGGRERRGEWVKRWQDRGSQGGGMDEKIKGKGWREEKSSSGRALPEQYEYQNHWGVVI